MTGSALKANKLHLRNSERGVSMLELAILLPLIMILIGGLIDVGLKINKVKTVAEASLQAARIAASSTKNHLTPRACGAALSEICGPITDIPDTAKPVTLVAKEAACQYIASAGLTPSDWVISVPKPKKIPEAWRKFYTVKVTIQRNTRSCFICYDKYLPALNASSSSSFLLEGVCS